MRLLAVFDEGKAPPRLDGLQYEIFSGEPHHPAPVASPILSAAVSGGFLGGLGGGALAVYTFRAMHLQTGHMAIVTLPPAGIIVFALAALGAIGSALVAFLVAARLPAKSTLSGDLRRRIANGSVAYVIETSSVTVERTMQDAGGTTEWLHG